MQRQLTLPRKAHNFSYTPVRTRGFWINHLRKHFQISLHQLLSAASFITNERVCSMEQKSSQTMTYISKYFPLNVESKMSGSRMALTEKHRWITLYLPLHQHYLVQCFSIVSSLWSSLVTLLVLLNQRSPSWFSWPSSSEQLTEKRSLFPSSSTWYNLGWYSVRLDLRCCNDRGHG